MISFTVIVHREVSNDHRCGVRWGDERYIRGGCVAGGHRHRVYRSDSNMTGAGIFCFSGLVFGLCRWGCGGEGLVLLLGELVMKRIDLNHRIGVDFALGDTPWGSLWRVSDRRLLVLPSCGRTTYVLSIRWLVNKVLPWFYQGNTN